MTGQIIGILSFAPILLQWKNEIRERIRISAWISVRAWEKILLSFFYCFFPVINGILSAFIHPSLQSLAVPPPHAGDLQENPSLDLSEPQEERLEGQPQQDSSLVRFSKDFRPVRGAANLNPGEASPYSWRTPELLEWAGGSDQKSLGNFFVG